MERTRRRLLGAAGAGLGLGLTGLAFWPAFTLAMLTAVALGS